MEPIKTLGQLLEGKHQRDAIHIAIAPVKARSDLEPGEHVSLEDGYAVSGGQTIGVVDPFLKSTVYKGAQFWLFLYPNTIVGLRHEWAHPAFVESVNPDSASVAWLKDFAAGYDMNYEQLIQSAKDSIGQGYMVVYGDAYGVIGNEFWDHFEAATGMRVSAETRQETSYSCSC